MNMGLKALASSVFGLAIFGLGLFLPAGTFNYWQAWVFIGVFFLVTVGPSIYWAVTRPEILRRRMNAGPAAETRTAQKIIVTGIELWFVAILVISALDHRFGWSHVPVPMVFLGNVLVVVGLGMAMLVIQQNSYASANITVEADQHLASTGLYGLVRHPMYLGALVMAAGMPLALDSYWGLVCLIPGLVVFGYRILDEEKLLRQELTGYREYAQTVRYRLLPYVW